MKELIQKSLGNVWMILDDLGHVLQGQTKSHNSYSHNSHSSHKTWEACAWMLHDICFAMFCHGRSKPLQAEAWRLLIPRSARCRRVPFSVQQWKQVEPLHRRSFPWPKSWYLWWRLSESSKSSNRSSTRPRQLFRKRTQVFQGRTWKKKQEKTWKKKLN